MAILLGFTYLLGFATEAEVLNILMSLAVGTMLVLLIFVGEAVRDAFDPRKLVLSNDPA